MDCFGTSLFVENCAQDSREDFGIIALDVGIDFLGQSCKRARQGIAIYARFDLLTFNGG